MKTTAESNLRARATEFSLKFQNNYTLLNDEDLNIDQTNQQFNDIIKEVVVEEYDKNDKFPGNSR